MESRKLFSLNTLDLSMNHISKVGVGAICAALVNECLPALRKFAIALNDISNDGVLQLGSAVHHGKLDHLEVYSATQPK